MKALLTLAMIALVAACSAAPPPPSTAVAPASSAAAPTLELPPDGQPVTDALAKAGRPAPGTVDDATFPFPVASGRKSPDGYPIYLIECSDLTKTCVGPTGQAIGSLKQVAASITPIRNSDVMNPQYHCALLCTDAVGNVVGGVSPEMLQYLTTQKASAKTNGLPSP